jgi:glycosyltransferase involved in cell wall biosynthesis
MKNKIRIIFCWADVSGYMSSCWKEFSRNESFELKVVAFKALTSTSFSSDILNGVSNRLLDMNERNDSELILRTVVDFDPQIVVLCGWFHAPYRLLIRNKALSKARFVLTMDTPWQATAKQRIGVILLRKFMWRFDLVVATGERSWQYARRLMGGTQKIQKGMYGINYTFWNDVAQERNSSDWPKRFLFVGRYSEEKGIVKLVEAYKAYRQIYKDDSWEFHFCGQGKFKPLLKNVEGIFDHGFVQPDEMALHWRQAGVFILPSSFDPWPLALVEACASGLPVICTSACGSSVEVVQNLYNGLVIPADEKSALVKAMVYMHNNHRDLAQMGAYGRELTRAYSSEMWTKRWSVYMESLVNG